MAKEAKRSQAASASAHGARESNARAERRPVPPRNAVRPTAPAVRRDDIDRQKQATAKPAAPRRNPVENSIRQSSGKVVGQKTPAKAQTRPAGARGNGQDPTEALTPLPSRLGDAVSPPASAGPSDQRPVPEAVRRQFVQVGRKYYFPDGARAFTDRGSRLTTPSENTEVIRSLIVIAQARGWNDITVNGTERFRKEAWFAARLAGIDVRGYRPTDFEQERLARAAVRRGRSGADDARPSPQAPRGDEAESALRERSAAERPRRGALLIGRLIDHGRATYLQDPHEPMSYFAKIETERGERTLWGVDLERAFKQSLTRPQIGDEIGLRPVRKDAVTVKAPERDAHGQVIGEKNLDTHRNRWIVEKRAFFEAREEAAQTVRDPSVVPQEAVKRHPELAGTYLYLRGAEEIARRRIRDPEDQRRFVATIRGALADSVARGEPLAPVRLRERAPPRPSSTRPARAVEREPASVRG